jgi:hypothetical protein
MITEKIAKSNATKPITDEKGFFLPDPEAENRAKLQNTSGKIITVSAVFLPIIIGYFMGGKKGALIGGGLVVVSVVVFAAYLMANWK